MEQKTKEQPGELTKRIFIVISICALIAAATMCGLAVISIFWI